MSLKSDMFRFPNTLTFRLTFWYAVAFVIFLAVAFVIFYLSLYTALNQRMESDLQEDLSEFRILLQNEGMHKVTQEIEREVKSGDEDKIFIRLLTANGDPIYASDLSGWRFLPVHQPVIDQTLSTKPFVLQDLSIEGHEYDAKAVYGFIAPDIVLHIGESTEEVAEIMALLPVALLIMLLLVIPMASVIGWLMARQAVKGIKEVSRTAAEIEKGRLDRRVSVQAQGQEIQYLVNTFNAMLDRIWTLISEMKEMTDNIAHDLRSPLARIRVISELALSSRSTPKECKTAAADTIEECDRLLQMVNSTLDVAEAEAGTAQVEKREINVSQLVKDACELFEAVAEQKLIKLTCKLDVDCRISGDIHNLQRMLANLLDNALKYTLAHGQVNIGLTCTAENIEITVSDTGVGIPDGDQVRVFDRFFRCDQSRSHDGCGLGLSYSRAVARAHGGDITLSSTVGKGTAFVIQLPTSH